MTINTFVLATCCCNWFYEIEDTMNIYAKLNKPYMIAIDTRIICAFNLVEQWAEIEY